MSIGRALVSQGVKPSGAFGWTASWIVTALESSGLVSSHRQIAELLELKSDDEVLDVACGSGVFLKKYASHVGRIAGLDHSDVQVGVAKRLHKDRIAAGTAEIVQGDGVRLPWPDNTFSAVTSNCLGCFADPEPAAREILRVLKPGGRVVLMLDRAEKKEAARKFEERTGLHWWGEAEARQLMEQTGFKDARLQLGTGRIFAVATKG